MSENRENVRLRTLKAGVIAFDKGSISCVVRNVSVYLQREAGAREDKEAGPTHFCLGEPSQGECAPDGGAKN
jgi:hypothetical protein